MSPRLEELIEKIKDTIVQGIDPDKIVLFGSFGSGLPDSDSDLDLLIIKELSLRRDKRARLVKDLFDPYPHPMDIFVYTPAEVEKCKGMPGSFVAEILNTGKVIYERSYKSKN